jgi:putative transposase
MNLSKKKDNKDDGKNAFQKVTSVLMGILKKASLLGGNTKLITDTAAVMVKAAASHSSIHAARKRMRKGKSRRRIDGVLETLDLKRVEDETNAFLRADVKKNLHCKVLDASMDIHQIPYHGGPHECEGEIMRGKPKDGTTKFHAMATAYLIGKGGKRFTMAIKFVPRGTSMRRIAQDLLELLQRCGIKVRRLLLDRGFYSIDVVRLLMRLNIKFIIPMRGKRLEKRKGSYSTTYTMKSTKDGKPISQLVNAISVIKYNRGKRFKHHGAMQLCFITYGIDIGLYRVAELYRKRFGIESSYKLNKAIRPRTSSRNPARRLLLFGTAMLIQNTWVEVKLTFCRHVAKTSRQMITLRDFADILLSWVRRVYGEETRIEV